MTTFAEAFAKAWNMRPRRVEGDGHIRWFIEDKLVMDVTIDAYYRGGHVHREGCTCDALVHDAAFHERLRELGFG